MSDREGLARLKELIEAIEHLSILRVTLERAEYWETPGKASYLLAALAAAVTGKPATVGQERKLP